MFCITKWSKNITDSGEDQYTHRLPVMKQKLVAKFGSVPDLHPFRLLDDDGVVYAYGQNTDENFAPLDRYMPDYGCTEIQYKNKLTGRYETL